MLAFSIDHPPTAECYTLSLHDALPIWRPRRSRARSACSARTASVDFRSRRGHPWSRAERSEEHTSELQSRRDLVCRLLLEKKNKALRLYRAANHGIMALRS